MSQKAKDCFEQYKAGQISRRDLMLGAGKLGMGVYLPVGFDQLAAVRLEER